MSAKPSSGFKLTDLQLVVLSAASQRDDLIITIPEKLKGGAASTFVKTLIERGLADEKIARFGQPAWRRDHERGEGFILVMTSAAMAALGLEEEEISSTDVDPTEVGVEKSHLSGHAQNLADECERCAGVADPQQKPAAGAGGITDTATVSPVSRKGSKQALVLTMLEREAGASIAELAEETHWLPHTTRAVLTGLRKKGFAIERMKGVNGTLYRIAKEHQQGLIPQPVDAGASQNAGEI